MMVTRPGARAVGTPSSLTQARSGFDRHRRRGSRSCDGERARSGPLSGIKIIELAGIGPAPFTCMMLADAGAQVLRLERAPAGAVEAAGGVRQVGCRLLLGPAEPFPAVGGHRPEESRRPRARARPGRAGRRADRGFRPGVAERLGVGPEDCFARNKRLVYGRMTGWGQDGPMAPMAGHDIDYIAIGGALWSLGRADSAPVPPLNLVGDFGGGGMLLAFGMVAALLEAARSGEGQVVDAAMVDGAASLMTMIHAFHRVGIWGDERGAEHARHRRAVLRGLRDLRREVDGRWRHRSAVLRRADQGHRAERRLDAPAPDDTGRMAGHEGAVRRHLQDQDRATSGRRSSKAPTPAWRRSSRPGKRICTRTTWRARPSSRSMAPCSRRRRRASRRTPSAISNPRRLREPTRSRGWSSGAYQRTP